ncbi:competence/damage-inducible protein A [Clostridiaceae bacterium HSG29]|nr:competence/damage-inducible protein A [Clostridiaceae bacterium HSG29]
MKIAILNVGNEVVEGDVLNSNAKYLSEKIFNLGHTVMFHSVCRDRESEIKEFLEFLSPKVDFLILTGGLGPTKDDMTKEVLSRYLDVELIKNAIVLENIKEKFKKFNRVMTENNIKQSYVIKGAKILFNEKGTAPGFLLEKEKCSYVLLPGPPREMRYLFEKYIYEYLKDRIDNHYINSKIIKISGLGESYVESNIVDLINNNKIYIATYASLGEVKVKISSNNEDELKKARKIIIDRFRDNIVSFTMEENSKAVTRYLVDNNISISTAESCTGGLLASEIVDNSGVSKIFKGSYVTYSNEMKTDVLDVKNETLDEYGAVSSEVAKEMLNGLNEKMNTDIAVAITGIAGPNGGSIDKPVGLVYIALKIFDSNYIIKNNFRGNRTEIRNRTCKKVFNVISQKIIIDKLL